MYTEFLKALGEIAEHLDAAVKVGGGPTVDKPLPTPYITGSIDVYLELEKVGEFRFEDEWVVYYPKEKS